jgi:hypothetical protein
MESTRGLDEQAGLFVLRNDPRIFAAPEMGMLLTDGVYTATPADLSSSAGTEASAAA